MALQKAFKPERPSGNDLVDAANAQISELENRSLVNVAHAISDTAMFMLELTPQHTFSVVALGETLEGDKVRGGSRVLCAALSGPGITYLGGKAWKISGALLKRVTGKSAREVEDILRKECCAATKVNPNVEKPPYLPHIKGQTGEAAGWKKALKEGQVPIQKPGPVTANGPDYVTLDPDGTIIVVWDAKFLGSGRAAPTGIPASQMQSWMSEVTDAIQAMPDGPDKIAAVQALQSGKVVGKIFNFP